MKSLAVKNVDRAESSVIDALAMWWWQTTMVFVACREKTQWMHWRSPKLGKRRKQVYGAVWPTVSRVQMCTT